ncbi:MULTISPECIES: SLBB domain-containing protein [unclassified Streptomyces]|uniref:SLBB domain-containing protein n=2 Tax=Streptomyces TaxID=1883 RepID=UPI0011AC149D|nr:SLBB domain-containing protein [Streptomyces sp. BK340]TVZ91770.1 NADH-ubiquinone oxidoreductase subunit F-like iron-sulfur protein [Streptomyces sp. BK340]
MLVTVSGAVAAPGVLEVALGTPLAALLDHAKGPTRSLRAVLLGGFAGTWLPTAHLHTPLTRRDLALLGAAPGAGVLIALPRAACALAETARMLAYLAAHSARQCGPCRYGLPAVAEDFAALAAGRADTDLLSRLRRRTGLLPDRAPAVTPTVPLGSPPPPCTPSPTTSTTTSPTAPAPPPTGNPRYPCRPQLPRTPGDDRHPNPAHRPHPGPAHRRRLGMTSTARSACPALEWGRTSPAAGNGRRDVMEGDRTEGSPRRTDRGTP